MAVQGCVLGLFFLSLAFVNISSTPQNNWLIALLQILVVLILLLGPARRAFTYKVLLWLGALGLALLCSNSLARLDGVGMADGRRAVEVVLHCVFGVVCYAVLRENRAALNGIIGGLLLSVTLYVGVWLSVWFSLEAPRQYDWFYAPPLFTHIRSLGLSFAIMPIVAAWLWMMRAGVWRGLAMLAYLLSFSLVLWSGGRGAILAMLLGILLLSLAFHGRRYALCWVGLAVATLLALALSAAFNTDQSGIGWWGAWLRSGAAMDMEQLSSRRLSMWLYLIDYIAQRPWFGWGGEAFRALWPSPLFVQAHNSLIQMLLEWGIVGAIAGGATIGFVLQRSARAFFARPPVEVRQHLALGFAICLALLVFSMVDGVFYRGAPSALLAFSCALLMAESARVRAGAGIAE